MSVATGSQGLGTPYSEGVVKGVLRYQRCVDCDAAQTLARYACCRCGSENLAWRDALGTGTVYATARVTRAPSDDFRALAPYNLVLVDLDEGPRVMAHGIEGLAIGDVVAARPLAHTNKQLIVFHRALPPLNTASGEDQ